MILQQKIKVPHALYNFQEKEMLYSSQIKFLFWNNVVYETFNWQG